MRFIAYHIYIKLRASISEGCQLWYQLLLPAQIKHYYYSVRKIGNLEERNRNKPASWNFTRVLRSRRSRLGPSISNRYLRAQLFSGTGRVVWMATASTPRIMVNPNSHRDWEWAGVQFPDRLVVLRIVSGRLMLYPQHVVMLPGCRKPRGGLKCPPPPTWTMDTQTLPSRCSRGCPSCNHILQILRNDNNKDNSSNNNIRTSKRRFITSPSRVQHTAPTTLFHSIPHGNLRQRLMPCRANLPFHSIFRPASQQEPLLLTWFRPT